MEQNEEITDVGEIVRIIADLIKCENIQVGAILTDCEFGVYNAWQSYTWIQRLTAQPS